MRDHDNARTSGTEGARTPVRNPATRSGPPLHGLMALQGTVGNAAVVQMLRQPGHLGAQEQHQLGVGRSQQQTEEPTAQRSLDHDVPRSAGRPLDDATRTDMETRFGAGFSDVRIHDGASAAEVGAHAYTSGRHVVLGDGGGDKHTLAHVVRSAVGSPPVQRAVGVELETGFSVGAEEPEYVHNLVGGPVTGTAPNDFYFHMDIDHFGENYIIELVSTHARVMNDEVNRPTIDDTLTQMDKALSRLQGAHPGDTLDAIFPASRGYVVPEPAKGVQLTTPVGDLRTSHRYAQYSIGTPLAGGYRMLELAQTGITKNADEISVFEYARKNNKHSLTFADRIAAQFAGLSAPPDLNTRRATVTAYDQDLADRVEAHRDPDVQDLRGFMAIVASQVGALVVNHIDETDLANSYTPPKRPHAALPKNGTLVMSRTSLAAMRDGLSDQVKSFLDGNARQIRLEFEQLFRSVFRDELRGLDIESAPLGELLFKMYSGDEFEFSGAEYFDNALKAHPDRVIDQQDPFGLHTHMTSMDTNDGRRAVPMVVLELRLFGQRSEDLTLDGIKANVRQLADLAREADDAVASRGPMPSRLLSTVLIPFPSSPRLSGATGRIDEQSSELLEGLARQIVVRAVQLKTMGTGSIDIDITGFGAKRSGFWSGSATQDEGQKLAELVAASLLSHVTIATSGFRIAGNAFRITANDIRFRSTTAARESVNPARVEIRFSEGR